jgi:hypothetical protein
MYSISPNNTTVSRVGVVTVGNQTVVFSQPAQSCVYTVSPASFTVESGGGSLTTYLSTSAGCQWTAVSSVSWINLAFTGYGTSSAAVTLTVQANPQGNARYGTVVIGGQPVQVTQLTGSCVYSVSPTVFSINGAGGTAAIVVSSPSGCSWNTGSSVSWITIVGVNRNDYGSGVVTVSIQPNPTSAARSGYLSIAGQLVTVNQTAMNSCSYALSAYSASFPATGGSGYVVVSAPSSCPWYASSYASWLQIYSGGSGMASGLLYYTVTPNYTGVQRSTVLYIGSLGYTVTQAPY